MVVNTHPARGVKISSLTHGFRQCLNIWCETSIVLIIEYPTLSHLSEIEIVVSVDQQVTDTFIFSQAY